jgi:hypothetical protein
MRRQADVVFGLEMTELGERHGQKWWQMTIDCWDGRSEKIVRYQLVGPGYNGWPEGPPERTLAELARVQSDFDRRDEIAAELDRLDREAIAQMEPIMAALRRAQAVVLYGEETVAKLFDEEEE